MADEDEAYRRFVQSLPCCACRKSPPSEVHHETGAGMGLRAHDHRSMPLCILCHHDFHAAAGIFRRFKRAERTAWQEEQIAYTQALYGARWTVGADVLDGDVF